MWYSGGMSEIIDVVTRFYYPEWDDDVQTRYDFWVNECLSRLNDQTDSGFRLNVWVDDGPHGTGGVYVPEVGVAPVNFFTVTLPELEGWEGFANWGDVHGFEGSRVMIGLDSDDMVSPKFIETVRKESEGRESNVLVSFQPTKLDLKSGNRYRMKNYRLRNKCSPIFAMIQPDPDDRVFPYYKGHYRLPKDDRWDTVWVGEGLCQMGIHHLNSRTTIVKEDRLT